MTTEKQIKRLWIFLIVSGFLGLVFLGFFLINYYQYHQYSPELKKDFKNKISQMLNPQLLKKEGKLFIKTMLPEILKNWDIKSYSKFIQKERFSSEELSVFPFYLHRNQEIYGSLKEYKLSEGNVYLKGTSLKNAFIYAEYVVNDLFEKMANKKIHFTLAIFKVSLKNKWFLENIRGI